MMLAKFIFNQSMSQRAICRIKVLDNCIHFHVSVYCTISFVCRLNYHELNGKGVRIMIDKTLWRMPLDLSAIYYAHAMGNIFSIKIKKWKYIEI